MKIIKVIDKISCFFGLHNYVPLSFFYVSEKFVNKIKVSKQKFTIEVCISCGKLFARGKKCQNLNGHY